MFAKKYFAIPISILYASMMFFMLSCDKSSPTSSTSSGSVDAAVVGVWFNRADSSGSEIKADGKVIPLTLDQNHFLIAANIGTDTYTLSATGGSYTLTIKTKVQTRDTTITIKGTYTVTATTLTTIDPTGTMVQTKSAYGVNVFTYTGGGSGLTASPTSISVVVGSNATSAISGGTAPYTIQTAPTSTIATATISGTTLTVTGVAAGSTSVTVKDNASPANTVSIPITVTTSGGGGGGFTTAGSISFSSDKGNFSASGIYNGNATTGSGAGGMTSSSGGSYMLQVTGYRVNSATSIDIAIMTFLNSAPIATGTYTSSSSKLVMIYYFPAMNPADTTEKFYMLTTSTANISAISSSNAQGTFSGNGMYSAGGTLVPTNTIAVTSGTFNVPVMPLIALNILQPPIDNKIERIIKRIERLR